MNALFTKIDYAIGCSHKISHVMSTWRCVCVCLSLFPIGMTCCVKNIYRNQCYTEWPFCASGHEYRGDILLQESIVLKLPGQCCMDTFEWRDLTLTFLESPRRMGGRVPLLRLTPPRPVPGLDRRFGADFDFSGSEGLELTDELVLAERRMNGEKSGNNIICNNNYYSYQFLGFSVKLTSHGWWLFLRRRQLCFLLHVQYRLTPCARQTSPWELFGTTFIYKQTLDGILRRNFLLILTFFGSVQIKIKSLYRTGVFPSSKYVTPRMPVAHLLQ